MRLDQVKDPDVYMLPLQEAIHSHPQGRYHHRLHVVLMTLQLRSTLEAAALFHEPLRTVQHWMQRFFACGIEGLQDEPIPGRPSRLNALQKQEIKEAVMNPPRFVGYSQHHWDGKLLSHHIQKTYHITLKVRQCQYLLHELGFTLQRPRSMPKGDPEKQAEFKKKTNELLGKLKEFFMKDPMEYYPHYRDEQESLPVTIMAEDEVHFYQGTTVTRKWSLKGKQPTLWTPPGRKKIGYFGAVDLLTGKLITMPEEEQFTQYTFQEFLEWVLRFTHGKIIFLLDNAKWHHAKRIQQFVEKHKDRLELLFLPPYSPQLNPIERVWRITRLKFTHNRYFMSIYDLMSVLTMQFLRWSDPNEELKTLCATI